MGYTQTQKSTKLNCPQLQLEAPLIDSLTTVGTCIYKKIRDKELRQCESRMRLRLREGKTPRTIRWEEVKSNWSETAL